MLIPRSSSRRSRGLTLIELAVTMVVLGLMMAAVVPTATSWMRGLRVRNAAESLRAGVETARMEALRRNSQVSFWLVTVGSSRVPDDSCALSSSSPGWVISVVDPSSACGAAASLTDSPQLVQRSQASESASDLSVSALGSDGTASNHVTFNGLGQVITTGAPMQTIDVSASVTGGRRLRVVVEPGGAIRMCDRDVGSTDPRACPAL